MAPLKINQTMPFIFHFSSSLGPEHIPQNIWNIYQKPLPTSGTLADTSARNRETAAAKSLWKFSN